MSPGGWTQRAWGEKAQAELAARKPELVCIIKTETYAYGSLIPGELEHYVRHI